MKAKGRKIADPEYDDSNWNIATVPGTILVSYLNLDAIPDPGFGDNQLMISDSFFNSDFWYRNSFTIPFAFDDKRVFLNFDGINWKAKVFFNGCYIGDIEGAFTRGRFDVTELARLGGTNSVAIRIIKNATPGKVKEQTAINPGRNGGALGGDKPAFHASAGRDWSPFIRGRNTGIWNDVYLTATGPVTLEDPLLLADLPLPDTSVADIRIEVRLQNHEAMHISGILQVRIGDILVEEPVTVEGFDNINIELNPMTHPGLKINNPRLWWPNGYGEPYLYDVDIRYIADEAVSDRKTFRYGIREMSYSDANEILKIWVNGRRFIGRGGNWGFPEFNLQYREREYDIAVHYHKDMNFTMIRNWAGQTGDDGFFEACDRHGIMVWQDFWLANPVDGPNPFANEIFMDNVHDFVKRIRNHPSIALYAGRNVGDPPAILDTAIRNLLPVIHPGIHYISNAASGVVSGSGPYRSLPPELYFRSRATPKMHSEMGMPNIVTYESLEKMMPDSTRWPVGRMWGIHGFCLEGVQGGASFLEQMDIAFGKPESPQKFTEMAQWINYRGYRAMFEAQSKYRMGLLLWMSHPAWPSMVWQTYDYYFEPTAAYFACKKASEPLHIQWNPLTDSIEVVNYHSRKGTGLAAKVQLYNMDGSLHWEKDKTLDCPEDSTVRIIQMQYPGNLSTVHFIRLKLTGREGLISENFYWRSLHTEKLPDYWFYSHLEEYNMKALYDLPEATLETKTDARKVGDNWFLTTQIHNTSSHPALMIRLKVVKETGGERILPVFYEDNYVALMPGEQKTIRMKLRNEDTMGVKPGVEISGFNIRKSKEEN